MNAVIKLKHKLVWTAINFTFYFNTKKVSLISKLFNYLVAFLIESNFTFCRKKDVALVLFIAFFVDVGA